MLEHQQQQPKKEKEGYAIICDRIKKDLRFVHHPKHITYDHQYVLRLGNTVILK